MALLEIAVINAEIDAAAAAVKAKQADDPRGRQTRSNGIAGRLAARYAEDREVNAQTAVDGVSPEVGR